MNLNTFKSSIQSVRDKNRTNLDSGSLATLDVILKIVSSESFNLSCIDRPIVQSLFEAIYPFSDKHAKSPRQKTILSKGIDDMHELISLLVCVEESSDLLESIKHHKDEFEKFQNNTTTLKNEVKNSVDDLKSSVQESIKQSKEEIIELRDSLGSQDKKIKDKIDELEKEVYRVAPSLKSGKLIESFDSKAEFYKYSSWALLLCIIGVSIFMVIYSHDIINTTMHKVSSEGLIVSMSIESLVRLGCLSFGAFALYILTSSYRRSLNLHESYSHKSAIGDFYVSMFRHIDDVEPNTEDYKEYLRNMAVSFTEEIMVPPRKIHNAYRKSKVKAKLKHKTPVSDSEVSTTVTPGDS